jgi:high affinity sulfate transporter 1
MTTAKGTSLSGNANGSHASRRSSIKTVPVDIPPPDAKEEILDTLGPLKALLMVHDDPFWEFRRKTPLQKIKTMFFYLFPILEWGSQYELGWLLGDVVAGLTIASLAVPQDLAYAGLAKVPATNGLYSSFVPPLIYSVLGTSRHIAIGPTAVVSLLIGTLCPKTVDPTADPTTYLQFVYTTTFFSGVIQAAMGVLRLGFIIDFLSHATIVGFMAGAAITIGASQLKGFLGYKAFTTKTDLPTVLWYVFDNTAQFNGYAFAFGICTLVFLGTLKVLSWYYKRHRVLGKVFFFANCLGPLTSIIICTLAVYLSKCNASPQKVPIVGQLKAGFSGISSANEIFWSGTYTGQAAGYGVVVGLIALTEAIAIARTFAALHGYHVDGNKEMIAYGFMNLGGSLTSSIATTGSFSRSAVNHNAGGNTMLTNIIMSLVVVVAIACLTGVFGWIPQAVLSAIIINAVLTLFDAPAMWRLWLTDKIDFIVCFGTFCGVIFSSVEIGLLVGVAISMFKILVLVTRPHLAVLGEIPGTLVFRNIRQYRYAKTVEGVLAIRVDAPIFFTSANYLREKILIMVDNYEEVNGLPLTHVVLDFTPVSDIDTTGIHNLEELYRLLHVQEIQLGIANPSHLVLRKLSSAGFIDEIGEENMFMSVNEAAKTFSMIRESVREPRDLEEGEGEEDEKVEELH